MWTPEGWSPERLIKYGFRRRDDSGNIVSIWNFGELDDVLRKIDNDEKDLCEGEDALIVDTLGAYRRRTDDQSVEVGAGPNAETVMDLDMAEQNVVASD